jgi:hypothetical protein
VCCGRRSPAEELGFLGDGFGSRKFARRVLPPGGVLIRDKAEEIVGAVGNERRHSG